MRTTTGIPKPESGGSRARVWTRSHRPETRRGGRSPRARRPRSRRGLWICGAATRASFQGVQAGVGDDTAVVSEPALLVEHRHVEPGVVGPEPAVAPRRPRVISRRSGGRSSVLADRGTSVGAKSMCSAATSGSFPSIRAHSSKEPSRRSSFKSASEQTFRKPPEKSARPSRALAQRPTSPTPIAASALRSRVIRSGVPTSWGEGNRRARERSSSSSYRWSHTPEASIHQRTSRPRYVRGSRTCSPTEEGSRVVLIASSSAANCTPVAEAPTTRTPPSGSWDGDCGGMGERRQLLDLRRQRSCEGRHRLARCRRRSRSALCSERSSP